MFRVENLTKIYITKKNGPVKALDSISLQLPETGMICIVGRSGCGKTTLLNMLAGLDIFDEGEIIFKDKKFSEFKESDFNHYRNYVCGFVFQEKNLLTEFNVFDNIDVFVRLQKRDDRQATLDALRQVELEGYESRRVTELSGGQRQRVAVARALAKKSKIIFADEPTGSLDEKTARQLFELLKRLSNEKLVLIVTHDLEFAKEYADRIIELSEGKIKNDYTNGST